jgi:hypothetical protein
MRLTGARWFSPLFVVTIVLAGFFCVAGLLASQGKAQATARTDILVLDGMEQFGDLTRPAVVFFHDAHQKAVVEAGGNCATCHMTKDDSLSLLFMRTADDSREQVMKAYHDNCIACHKDTKAAGRATGPVTCGQCHKARPDVESAFSKIAFDRSLHFRHVQDEKNKCEACHHSYNEQTEKLYYKKGEEASCLYCHGEKPVGKAAPWQNAAHNACVLCHKGLVDKNEKAGPVECAGCHSAEARKTIKIVEEPPRYTRNQPDYSLIQTPMPEGRARMEPVSFAHMAHEDYEQSCRACHHKSLEACNTCHTVAGDKKGDFVNLSSAMHQVSAQESCVGCHASQQRAPECAGCHVAPLASGPDKDSCVSCHQAVPPADRSAVPPEMAHLKDEQIAAFLALEKRRPITKTIPQDDIPEIVVMNQFSNQYQGSNLPHRKIVNTLLEKMRDSNLAGYFHREEGLMCAGCHHNSPVSKKPPRCTSCHAGVGGGKDLARPGAVAAYHQQCIGCHEVMGIEKAMSCTACHKEKNENRPLTDKILENDF